MELVAPPPTELTALVDPAARGAAPLLRSVTKDGDGPVAAVPFGLFLELLAARVPAGQELPAAGKGLPLPLPASSATALAGAPVAMLPGPAPLPLLEMAAAGLRLESAASLALTAPATVTAPPAPTFALAPNVVPNAALVPTAPPTTLAEPLVPPVVPTELPTAPSGVDTPTVDPVLEPETPALRELFATTPDQRLRPPPVDARAATTTQAPPAADAEPRAAAPPAEIAAPVLRVVQRDGSHFTLRPVVAAADAASTAPADWLPATTGHASTHAATATHSAAAPAQASLDMNAPDWHEAFASRVQWLVDTKVGEAHIKLNPPELGAVDVKISLVDDQTFVQLTAATPSARDELSHGLPRLRELLIAGGLDLGGASVHSGRDGRHEAGGYASQAATRLDPAVLDPAHHDEPTASAPRRIASRIDVFA